MGPTIKSFDFELISSMIRVRDLSHSSEYQGPVSSALFEATVLSTVYILDAFVQR